MTMFYLKQRRKVDYMNRMERNWDRLMVLDKSKSTEKPVTPTNVTVTSSGTENQATMLRKMANT